MDSRKGGIPLPVRIGLGLVAGLALAVAARAALSPDQVKWWVATIATPVGDIFLNSMFLVVLPLIFSSLALGVAGLGDLETVGRLGARILAGTVVLTGVGVFVGILLVNVVQPGHRAPAEARDRLVAATKGDDVQKRLDQAAQARPFTEVLPTFVSRNPVEDAANAFTPNPNYKGGGIIAFLFFAAIVGAAIASVGAEKSAPLVSLLESIQAISMAIIGFAMALAPFGVAALVFKAASVVGLDLLRVLAAFVLVVIGGLAIHLFGTYSIVLAVAGRHRPVAFFRAIQEVIVTAFSTSSSNATLPTSLRVAQEKLHLHKATSSFVLTVGSTANQNGTALFEGVTILFLAQFYGIELSLGQQFTVVMMSILAGVGTAGVPGGSIPLIVLVLQQVGIPAEGIGIVLGVDRLLDMCRTVVNVVGDMVLAEICDPGPRQ